MRQLAAVRNSQTLTERAASRSDQLSLRLALVVMESFEKVHKV